MAYDKVLILVSSVSVDAVRKRVDLLLKRQWFVLVKIQNL